MRVIAGRFGRRTLRGPRRLKVRPTSDRLRETLFNVLGEEVAGSVFVDAYAGTGAVGIEALSRGARYVAFIEQHGATSRLIAENLKAVGATEGFELLCMDAVDGFRELAARGVRANFVFLDPPYGAGEECVRAMEAVERLGLLAEDGMVVAEHARRASLPAEIGRLRRTRLLEQGDSSLSFYRRG